MLLMNIESPTNQHNMCNRERLREALLNYDGGMFPLSFNHVWRKQTQARASPLETIKTSTIASGKRNSPGSPPPPYPAGLRRVPTPNNRKRPGVTWAHMGQTGTACDDL